MQFLGEGDEGLVTDRAWSWQHDQCGRTVWDSPHICLAQVRHQLRESWRRMKFQKFLNSNRHEAAAFSNVVYSERRCEVARQSYTSTTI